MTQKTKVYAGHKNKREIYIEIASSHNGNINDVIFLTKTYL